MINLSGARVFLSASFPSGQRGAGFRPYDAVAVAEAVTALAQSVLTAGGRLVFGAHPTISPLVLLVAGELGRLEVVEIHQSRHFEGRVPQETLDLVDRGYGIIRWSAADPADDLAASLHRMRREMLGESPLAAGVFVGGMEGVREEYEMLAELQPLVPRVPLRAPGGATRGLAPSRHPVVERLGNLLDSPRYPAVARALVSALDPRGS